MCYVDFTSLYPYVNANCSYPLQHPTIIREDFGDPQQYFGLISATVHPPRGLFFPILPYKTSQGKLVFTLCRTCAEINHQSSSCTHDEEARALKGVWVTIEFNKAIELGYRVSRITEVWHFKVSRKLQVILLMYSVMRISKQNTLSMRSSKGSD